jgi:hypothetical protein
MAHREVSIAVFGMVVGTMLGAGTIIFGHDVAANLMGSADEQFVAYREGIIFQNDFRRRAISEQERRTRPQARIRATDREVDMGTDGPVVDIQECVQKVRIAEELRSIVIPIIPGRAIDQLVRSSIQDAFDEYVAECQSYYDEYMSGQEEGIEMEVEEVPTVFESDDDYCKRFTGSRRSRCVVEQRENSIQYRGR